MGKSRHEMANRLAKWRRISKNAIWQAFRAIEPIDFDPATKKAFENFGLDSANPAHARIFH
jgi:hypothetical protein